MNTLQKMSKANQLSARKGRLELKMALQALAACSMVGRVKNYWIMLQRFFCLSLLIAVTACSTVRLDNAPVFDRSGGRGASAPPGYYRIKTGDTLYRIALEHGQNYRDIATWNNVQDPSQIEVGQLLRVLPPPASAVPGGVNAANSVTNSPANTPALNANATPNVATPNVATPNAAPETAGSVLPKPVVPLASTSNTPTKQTEPLAAAAISFAWPVQGAVLDNFEEGKNKGINIGGVAGTPVKAAADGRVVYAGNGLRGYGNLIIIKHNDQFLTAYAHNRALLVKENDTVKKGREIAEMGNRDAERVMLHFEIRRQGKPVDPLIYLPPLKP